jgi:bacterioferritin (cytochrome b1)
METKEKTVSPEVQATLDRFRTLRAEQKDQWFDLLNTIRYFELRGSGYLSYLAEVFDDPDMMAKMTKHASDEGKHAHFLNIIIRREGGKPSSRAGRMQMQLTPPIDKCPPRESLIQVFAGLQSIEKRAVTIFEAFEVMYENDPVVLSMVREVLKDEQFHINWIARYLDKWRGEGWGEKIDAAVAARSGEVQGSTQANGST